MKEQEQFSPAVETLHPISKEFKVLQFSMEMQREEDLKDKEVGHGKEGIEDWGVEKDVCQAENKESGRERDLLVISMKTTSISVVKGRGCGSGASCPECHRTGCTYNDVVMVSESSTVTLGE